MSKILENIMNFINENTTLLIVICVFLIFVLIGYLIDNSIKTRRLAKMEAQKGNATPEPINEPIKEKAVETKVEEPAPVVVEEVKTPETKVEEVPVVEPEEPSVEEVPVVEEPVQVVEPVVPETPVEPIPSVEEPSYENENTVEVPVIPVELPTVSEISVPEEPKANEFTIDPKINELLSRDFTKENETVKEEEPVKPIVTEVPAKEEKPKYSNSKSLAEILAAKKSTPESTNKEADLMNTVDFQHELDRLLEQLNEQSGSEKDNNLEETQDFTNMF